MLTRRPTRKPRAGQGRTPSRMPRAGNTGRAPACMTNTKPTVSAMDASTARPCPLRKRALPSVILIGGRAPLRDGRHDGRPLLSKKRLPRRVRVDVRRRNQVRAAGKCRPKGGAVNDLRILDVKGVNLLVDQWPVRLDRRFG